MFHSNAAPIDVVTYGNRILNYKKYCNYRVSDVYIQTYRRGHRSIISITRFILGGRTYLHTTYYDIVSNKCTYTTRKIKELFVAGAISLRLDVDSEKFHPFIDAARSHGGWQGKTWSISHYSRRSEDGPIVHRISYRLERFLISPIVNIDKQFRDTNHPPPSLSACSTKVSIGMGRDWALMWIKHGCTCSKFMYSIPPVEEGKFKPKPILESPYNFISDVKRYNTARHKIVAIDISSTFTSVPDIVILANLKRGDWLYTQHSFVPIMDQNFVLVKVVNSEKRCEIYETDDETFVTHVEVFDHVKSDSQYVVVNIATPSKTARLGEPRFEKNKRVYKPIVFGEILRYVELANIWVDPYLDMLYNIPIGPGADKQDAREIMVDTLLM
ncbi:uncharacterized protein BXIN_0584 [Babesia sp. Xinjiang]|uniref:uncharacterized protein n=1 Tax=Babesia sp. Xinjiang TaxID=462227 RepID=UPI000A21956D|nr:uncharacterized protein BXIN_0584 [Babesia sp. Xinjiang]ORM41822.1 hypothetical protein BXIN_0584 [Babesia sp. Xinjiang]